MAMDMEEYQMWRIRDAIEAHGERRQDLQWARTRALIATFSGKNQKMEKHELYEKQQTPEQLAKVFDAGMRQIAGA